jgi:hypothetical protein
LPANVTRTRFFANVATCSAKVVGASAVIARARIAPHGLTGGQDPDVEDGPSSVSHGVGDSSTRRRPSIVNIVNEAGDLVEGSAGCARLRAASSDPTGHDCVPSVSCGRCPPRGHEERRTRTRLLRSCPCTRRWIRGHVRDARRRWDCFAPPRAPGRSSTRQPPQVESISTRNLRAQTDYLFSTTVTRGDSVRCGFPTSRRQGTTDRNTNTGGCSAPDVG